MGLVIASEQDVIPPNAVRPRELAVKDWNINYIFDDVAKELEHRIENLGDLNNLKNKLQEDKWKTIRHQFEEKFNEFAIEATHAQ